MTNAFMKEPFFMYLRLKAMHMIYDLEFEGDYLPCKIGSGDPLTPSINRSPVIPFSYHFRFSWLLYLIQRKN